MKLSQLRMSSMRRAGALAGLLLFATSGIALPAFHRLEIAATGVDACSDDSHDHDRSPRPDDGSPPAHNADGCPVCHFTSTPVGLLLAAPFVHAARLVQDEPVARPFPIQPARDHFLPPPRGPPAPA